MEPQNESDTADLPLTRAQAQQLRHADNRDALQSLAKDARNVAQHSQVLQDQAERVLSPARARRAPSSPPPYSEKVCLTVPEACSIVGVCERTLRVALREPALADRLVAGTRKVGTFHKTIKLLPLDLVDDLKLRYAAKKKSVIILD